MNNRLKELRSNLGLTQKDMAKMLSKELGINVKQQNVQQYENKDLPPRDILRAYMKLFGVSSDYLLGFSDARSVNHDWSAISEVLGLSELAIERIIGVGYNWIEKDVTLVQSLDFMLSEEPEILRDVLYRIIRYSYYYDISFQAEDTTIYRLLAQSQLEEINKLIHNITHHHGHNYSTCSFDFWVNQDIVEHLLSPQNKNNTYTGEELINLLSRLILPVL